VGRAPSTLIERTAERRPVAMPIKGIVDWGEARLIFGETILSEKLHFEKRRCTGARLFGKALSLPPAGSVSSGFARCPVVLLEVASAWRRSALPGGDHLQINRAIKVLEPRSIQIERAKII
jgi:hypothetical protein